MDNNDYKLKLLDNTLRVPRKVGHGFLRLYIPTDDMHTCRCTCESWKSSKANLAKVKHRILQLNEFVELWDFIRQHVNTGIYRNLEHAGHPALCLPAVSFHVLAG